MNSTHVGMNPGSGFSTRRSARFGGFSRLLALLAATATIASGPAAGQTITVTTLNDVVDFPAPQTAAELPGADGKVSFREAVIAANNTPGGQTIKFAIPTSEYWLLTNMALLRLEQGTFVISGDDTYVDFTSQTGYAGDTNPNGSEVGIYGLQANALGVTAIRITGNRCTIHGLGYVSQRGYGVEISGHDNRVIGCTITGPLYAGVKVQGNVGAPATGNVIGGTRPGEGNRLSAGNAGVRVDGPTDGTVVIGNTLVGSPFAGVEVRGASCCPAYTPYNTRIGGPGAGEGNWIANNGKFGEEGFPLGDQVRVEWAVNTTIEGNLIGTNQAGDARFPNAHGTAGIAVRASSDTIIRGNVIAGIRKEGTNHHAGQVFGTGIRVDGPTSGVVIRGNVVGADASGTIAIPNLFGITFSWFQGNPAGGIVGGSARGEGNTVAYNERRGITVPSGIVGVTISGNSIHSNGDLGIDLLNESGTPGVSPNDPFDADSGGNSLQNFPVLDSARTGGGQVMIEGTLHSVPSSQFGLEFFASPQCDPAGHGEGAVFLGGIMASTNAAGNADFSATVSADVPAGWVITATATRLATGDTSEFSACIAAEAVPPADCFGDANDDGAVDFADVTAVLAAWGQVYTSTGPGDADNNGVVDFADLTAVLARFGTVCP